MIEFTFNVLNNFSNNNIHVVVAVAVGAEGFKIDADDGDFGDWEREAGFEFPVLLVPPVRKNDSRFLKCALLR